MDNVDGMAIETAFQAPSETRQTSLSLLANVAEAEITAVSVASEVEEKTLTRGNKVLKINQKEPLATFTTYALTCALSRCVIGMCVHVRTTEILYPMSALARKTLIYATPALWRLSSGA